MTELSPDLLGRRNLYRYLERQLGDLTHLPTAMLAQQGRNQVRVQRIFDHDGQVVLSMSGQTIGPGFRSAPRPIAYVLVDLKRQKAQAAPHLQAFQSAYNLNLSQKPSGLSDRLAYRYGYTLERFSPQQKRQTGRQQVATDSRANKLRVKTPLKYRVQALLRKVADRFQFRLVEKPNSIPVQTKLSVRKSWLGAVSQQKDLGKALHDLGIPRDQLQGFPTLSQDQRFSRFCNLSTQKALNWLYDQNYRFTPQGPRRDLLFASSSQKPQEQSPPLGLKSLDYNPRSTSLTVQLPSGKSVKFSMTSGTKEAWNQILATPIRQQAERSVSLQGRKQEEHEKKLVRPLSHSYQRHSVRPPGLQNEFQEKSPRPLKIEERSHTQDGEVFKVRLRGGQTVYCAISDTSPEALQAIFSPKMQMERQSTPLTPSCDQNQQNHLKSQPQPSQGSPSLKRVRYQP